MITKFLLVLAWIFFVISTLVLLLKWIGHRYYHSDMNRLERLLDHAKGVTMRFRVTFWPYVLITSVAYLITFYFL